MRYGLTALLLLFQQPFQQSKATRIDLSPCDAVHITGPVTQLTVHVGQFDVYWFKRYSELQKLTLTCEVEARK